MGKYSKQRQKSIQRHECTPQYAKEFGLRDGDLVNYFTVKNMTFTFWKYCFDGSVSGELGVEEGGQLGSHCIVKQ